MRIIDWSSDVCSSDLDAMQIVLHGGDQRAIDLNAQSGGASGSDGRSIREYCLGFYRGEGHVRDNATTYLTMVFRDTTGKFPPVRSEEHTSELQSLMRISYAVFCLKKKK